MKPFRGQLFVSLVWLSLVLCAGSLSAQDSLEFTQPAAAGEWHSPDPAALPTDWWPQFVDANDQVVDARFDRLHASLREAVGQMDGEQLVAGRSLLQAIQTQFELLRLARTDPVFETFSPVAARDSYSLDQFLELTDHARDLRDQQRIPQLRIEELQHQADLLLQRQDNLLRQYEATDANTPDRILLGLRRIEARLASETTAAEFEQLEKQLELVEEQQRLVERRLDFAHEHLVADPDGGAAARQAMEAAGERVLELSDTQSSVQRQLLNVLAAPQSKPSLLVLRKQQLTRASVQQTLARLDYLKLQGERIWQRQRSAGSELGLTSREKLEAANIFIQETLGQAETWTAASRDTLLSPVDQGDLNAVKNMELAQSTAQQTLTYLEQVDRRVDDIQILAELITEDQLGMQKGLRSILVHLRLFSDSVIDSLSGYLDFTLFHVGEIPVTLGSVLTMLVILALGFAISWFIRHLVGRLKSRRQFASSPAVYTLGRLLHYIIIFIAVLAAFGSIGLDFSNFALIAGALSVGIGFGLQSVVNNFVSGLILLFEGSLRVGDYVELDTGQRGVVKEINTRATIIKTNDSVDLVVPNSKFVTNDLTNWTLREPLARFRIEFGVAYGSDKEQVREAAMEAASRVDYIVHNMPSRPIEVWLVGFGDSALVFQLLAWVSKNGVRRPERVRAAVLWELETQLARRDIKIPFPQRDLHLRSGFLDSPGEAPTADAEIETPAPSS